MAGLAGAARAAGWQICALLVALLLPTSAGADSPYLPARDPAPLLAAIARETPRFVPPADVTGITVPHHLLAVDLIARGFWAASAGHYSRIVLISPDHFHKVQRPFATTAEDLKSAFGTVASDAAGVAAVETNTDLVEVLPQVDYEHGLMVEAPFIKHFFPDAKVIPILASVNATPKDWRAMTELLKPLVNDTTLVVQSTDYSHYRPFEEAIRRDQESITAISTGDPAAVVPLLQPSHMDSKAAQYIQLALQQEVFHAQPVILANGSSTDYGGAPDATTSYVVSAFVRTPADGTAIDYPDEHLVFLAGDVLLGRYFLPGLRDPESWARIRDAVLGVTHGAPLIVNLEGVLLDRPVTGVDLAAHVMTSDDAAPVLAALNAKGASLANNHANDLGVDGLETSVAQLQHLGITPLTHGSVTDYGAFRLLALNFVAGRFTGSAIADPDHLDWVCNLKAAPPLVAFVHWGTEYTTVASDKERAIAETLARCGVALIVGVHSHQASPGIVPLDGGASQMIYSLGNFLFDQTSPRGSGALLELRLFKQGTVAARLVPIPNLFEFGRPD